MRSMRIRMPTQALNSRASCALITFSATLGSVSMMRPEKYLGRSQVTVNPPPGFDSTIMLSWVGIHSSPIVRRSGLHQRSPTVG